MTSQLPLTKATLFFSSNLECCLGVIQVVTTFKICVTYAEAMTTQVTFITPILNTIFYFAKYSDFTVLRRLL